MIDLESSSGSGSSFTSSGSLTVTYDLASAELAHMSETFMRLDADGDDRLSLDEAVVFFQELGIGEECIEKIMWQFSHLTIEDILRVAYQLSSSMKEADRPPCADSLSSVVGAITVKSPESLTTPNITWTTKTWVENYFTEANVHGRMITVFKDTDPSKVCFSINTKLEVILHKKKIYCK